MGHADHKRQVAAAHNAAATGIVTTALTKLQRIHAHNFLMALGPASQRRLSWDEQRRIADIQAALGAEEIEGTPKASDEETVGITLSVRDAEWLVSTAREFSGHAGAFARGLVPAIDGISSEIEAFKESARNGSAPAPGAEDDAPAVGARVDQ